MKVVFALGGMHSALYCVTPNVFHRCVQIVMYLHQQLYSWLVADGGDAFDVQNRTCMLFNVYSTQEKSSIHIFNVTLPYDSWLDFCTFLVLHYGINNVQVCHICYWVVRLPICFVCVCWLSDFIFH